MKNLLTKVTVAFLLVFTVSTSIFAQTVKYQNGDAELIVGSTTYQTGEIIPGGYGASQLLLEGAVVGRFRKYGVNSVIVELEFDGHKVSTRNSGKNWSLYITDYTLVAEKFSVKIGGETKVFYFSTATMLEKK